MSYIGNGPEVNAFTLGVDKFNGTGACTQFTLTRSISDSNAIEVLVNGVQQEPTASYSVTNGVLIFDEAPSSGSNNIIVRYLAPIVVTFNQVSKNQILPNAVGTPQLEDNSVVTNKIADGSVTETKLNSLSVSGSKIGISAISGNNMGDFSISTNNIVVQAITGNLIANNAVSGNNIASPPDIFDDAFLFGGM